MGVANANLVWSDEKVCRNFLCGTCPHTLFTNTVSFYFLPLIHNTPNSPVLPNPCSKLLPSLFYPSFCIALPATSTLTPIPTPIPSLSSCTSLTLPSCSSPHRNLPENGPRRLSQIAHRTPQNRIPRRPRSKPERPDVRAVPDGIRVEHLRVCG